MSGMTGKVHKPSTLIKMAEAHKGSKAYNWKGDKVGYQAKHAWITLWKGKPRICEECKTTVAKKFEWANISGKYKRELNDYKRLCTSCHRKFDMTDTWRNNISKSHKGNIPWNKGLSNGKWTKEKTRQYMKVYSQKYYQRRKLLEILSETI